jgi:exodeoxyribonuclease-3
MKLVSWNVNGIRACINKGMFASMTEMDADVFALQETKITDEAFAKLMQAHRYEGFEHYSFAAEKAGYSSLAVFTRHTPLSVTNGLGIEEFDREGRVQTVEFDDFYVINAYFPNSQRDLKRLDYKMAFNNAMLEYMNGLREKKHVALCGDFNVSHQEIDLTNPKRNKRNAGFCPEERAWFTEMLEAGYIDTFREFESEGEHYSWWTYRNQARARNIGWRLDYWVIDDAFRSNLADSSIRSEIMGSDHCPVVMELTF